MGLYHRKSGCRCSTYPVGYVEHKLEASMNTYEPWAPGASITARWMHGGTGERYQGWSGGPLAAAGRAGGREKDA